MRLSLEDRMGKGDKRTKKGKIWRGSYGKTRNRLNQHAETAAAKKANEKK